MRAHDANAIRRPQRPWRRQGRGTDDERATLHVEGNVRNLTLVTTGEVEAAFRTQMLVLAPKGGAATKQRHGYGPRYSPNIGRLGGLVI